MKHSLLVFLLLLASCGGAAAPTPEQVRAALTGAGATNIHDQAFEDSVPVPRSFTTHQAFTIASVAPAGGQYFICDSVRNCDAIFAYYDALKALAGPYTYRSRSGLVVVQLNKGLTPGEAGAFATAVEGL